MSTAAPEPTFDVRTPLAGLDRAVRRLNGWRRAPHGPVSATAAYKEWMHFCVRLPGEPAGQLLVNFNATERALPSGPARATRMIALAHAGEWSGTVETCAPGDVEGAAGEVDVRFGSTSLRWDGHAFALRLHTTALVADLRIRPLMLPTMTSSVSFGPGHAMHWVVIPRLVASGTVATAGGTVSLVDALTYQDHNWGDFRWGGDLAWEWGFVTPQDPRQPWSVVFVRVSDGRGHRTLSQGVLLWKGGVNVRTFQNQEIRMVIEGCHAGPRPLTLPPSASMLVPGAASGVPERMTLHARGGDGDELDLAFETTSKARIALPSDLEDLRLVLLNETTGWTRVRGRTHAAGAFAFQGPAVVEFVRG